MRRRDELMLSAKIILCILSILAQTSAQPPAKGKRIMPAQKRIVIAASALLDGKGRVLRDARIVIEGSKIVAVRVEVATKAGPKLAPVDYDLRGLTVLPGWIDAHVHITWSFGK